jgi:hypothetical protein
MNEEDIARLVSRVDELEKKGKRQVRLMRCCVMAILALIATFVVQELPSVWGPYGRKIKARSVEIVDQNLATIVKLGGTDFKDGGGIYLYGDDHRPRSWWTVSKSSAQLAMDTSGTGMSLNASLLAFGPNATFVLGGNADSNAIMGIIDNKPYIDLYGKGSTNPLFHVPKTHIPEAK